MAQFNDPFACFGGNNSSSSSDDDGDCLTHEREVDINESHRLRNKSNIFNQPHAITDMLHEHQSSFEMFITSESGHGLRTITAYKRGDEIMREIAVMRIPNAQPAVSAEAAMQLHRNAVQRAYNSLHEITQQSVMALYSCNEDGIDVAKTPHGVYDSNSFRLENVPNGGLFLTIARINHSCRPNVTHHWSSELQRQLLFAARDIDIGEELFITYGPGQCMNTKGRRDYLYDKFMFVCRCEMCLEGNIHGGDDRMLKIQELQEDIALQSSHNTKEKLDSVVECLGLMKSQGLSGGAFTKTIYHHGHNLCHAAGDHAGAISYLNHELLAVQESEGIASCKAVEIELMLNQLSSY